MILINRKNIDFSERKDTSKEKKQKKTSQEIEKNYLLEKIQIFSLLWIFNQMKKYKERLLLIETVSKLTNLILESSQSVA